MWQMEPNATSEAVAASMDGNPRAERLDRDFDVVVRAHYWRGSMRICRERRPRRCSL